MRIAPLLIAAALVLCACGKQGVLERPDPMFGRPAPQETEPKTP